jgi:putative hydrolase of the HAD superfamily
MKNFGIIAFDADDTLWQNERLYARAQADLRSLLARYVAEQRIDAGLYETEKRNLDHFGYGIKAFALSMIETAIQLTDGRIAASDIQRIIDLAREMLLADVELIEQVPETVMTLASSHTLMLITKGDLRDQERKIERSRLGEYFRFVEIVSDKGPETYRAILDKHNTPAAQFLMIGNSLRSDILPVLELGGTAVYVPHELTWAHESAEAPQPNHPGFHQLDHIGQLPELIGQLEGTPTIGS